MKVIIKSKIRFKELFHIIMPMLIFFLFAFSNHITAGVVVGYFYLAITGFVYTQIKEASVFTYIILIFETFFFGILVPLSYF